MKKPELYTMLAQMVNNAESITWNRLYNFLTCNSILLLAWATLCGSNPGFTGKIAMVLLCLVGGISGIAWMELGRRGRIYLRFYKEYAKSLEILPDFFEAGTPKGLDKSGKKNVNKEFLPFEFEVGGCRFGMSEYILRWLPLIFTFLYVILLVITFFVSNIKTGC
jgi:hypothetical protein